MRPVLSVFFALSRFVCDIFKNMCDFVEKFDVFFDVVVLFEILAVFVCHLRAAVFVLIDEDFKREVKSDAWIFLHQKRAQFRFAKDDGDGGRELHTHTFGVCGVVDLGKDFYTLFLENLLKSVCSRIDVTAALFYDDAGLECYKARYQK